jgi:hypothetical protein
VWPSLSPASRKSSILLNALFFWPDFARRPGSNLSIKAEGRFIAATLPGEVL